MTRPPVAQLIYEQRMKAGLSIRQAAARAGISEGSWRRTEGPRKLTRTPETIARMAAAVDLTGDQLAKAGWPQAARILTTIAETQAPAAAEPSYADLVRRIAELGQEQRQSQADFEERMLRTVGDKLDRLLAQREREQEGSHEDNNGRRAG